MTTGRYALIWLGLCLHEAAAEEEEAEKEGAQSDASTPASGAALARGGLAVRLLDAAADGEGDAADAQSKAIEAFAAAHRKPRGVAGAERRGRRWHRGEGRRREVESGKGGFSVSRRKRRGS